MIYFRNRLKTTLLLSLLFLGSSLMAQQTNKIIETSEFEVAGTSTIHDWEMVSSSSSGKGNFTIQSGKVTNIESLEVSLKCKTLKSGKTSMDNNAYAALKADKNPYIKFKLKRVISKNNGVIRVEGDFTTGGTTKSEIIELKTTVTGGKVEITGGFDITFTEYKMEPPTTLMGTITTGNELEISFKLIFKNQ